MKLDLVCQSECHKSLSNMAKCDRHSILIDGPEGCGKTYMALQYSKYLGIDDFQLVNPKVGDIKEAIQSCYMITNPVVVCIENLDTGLPSASYTLLKFLEEPLSHVYIVVTCRNIQNIPDTIISRSNIVNICPPTQDDLIKYRESQFPDYRELDRCKDIWECVRTLHDVHMVAELNISQISYIQSIPGILRSKEAISSLSWKIQNYPEGGGPTPLELVIRYIMNVSDPVIWSYGHSCLKDLEEGRISKYAVLAKFLFSCKYS